MKNVNKSKSSTSECCLAFASLFANFSMALLRKVLHVKKACNKQKLKLHEATLFYKQLGSDLSPQSCLYFQSFQGSELLNGCLVV